MKTLCVVLAIGVQFGLAWFLVRTWLRWVRSGVITNKGVEVRRDKNPISFGCLAVLWAGVALLAWLAVWIAVMLPLTKDLPQGS